MIAALLPLKDLVAAKTRLAGLLSPAERRCLVQAMVQDVLQVAAQHAAIDYLLLVSDDPAAPLLARDAGVEHLPESQLGQRGLNAVLRAASDRLRGAGAESIVVLHGDLPLLSGADITAAIALHQQSGAAVIGCDRHGSGTNLLLLPAAYTGGFAFGPGSCQRHAELLGESRVLRRTGIGLDVDEPADLLLLLRYYGRGQADPTRGLTGPMLHGTDLGRRIESMFAGDTALQAWSQQELKPSP